MLGFAMVGASWGPPDSMTRTCAPEADNSAASTEPAAPAPTTMKSYCPSTCDTLFMFESPDARAPMSPMAFCQSEGILALTAMRVDPNQVAEVIQAAGPCAAPTAVAHPAHWRVSLVLDCRGVHSLA